MVWGLFPADSRPGEQMYFIFSKGTYKVGRKGCDVIINIDKGVSRIHAEVVIDSMTLLDPLRRISKSSNVRIKDCSKYGTFINKKLGSKEKVHDFPNKETFLKDGDLLSFGTGNAIYRFCFVPLILYVYCSKSFQVDHSLQEKISSIGACATQSWNAECTHVLVDDFSLVKEDLIDAIVAQKPVVLDSWVKVVAEKRICSEIPSCAVHVPTLTLEGLPVKIVEPKVRENCLAGYTFLLGSSHLYKFGERLRLLLDLGGAKVLSINEFCSSSQTSEDGANDRVVLAIPSGSVNQFDHFHHLRSLCRVNEMNLVSAVLSGHLDPSLMESPSILVSSSFSTDETIVADSDVEMDTGASDQVAESAQPREAIKNEDISEDHALSKKISGDHVNTATEMIQIPSSTVEDGGIIEKRDKGNEADMSGYLNSDIIYSQDMIVRDTNSLASVHSTTIKGVVNFKCFRKRETQSGNSFKNLIPFSKYPYKESDCGSEVAEHVKEEKKRTQMEAIAEDLFNNDKAKRRGIAGSSLRGLLTRG